MGCLLKDALFLPLWEQSWWGGGGAVWRGAPEVGRLRGGCGTLPSSERAAATGSVTALQSPPEVIYCAIKHFSVSVIFFLEARLHGCSRDLHLNCQHFILPTHQQLYTYSSVNTHKCSAPSLFCFFLFVALQAPFLSPLCLTSVTAK